MAAVVGAVVAAAAGVHVAGHCGWELVEDLERVEDVTELLVYVVVRLAFAVGAGAVDAADAAGVAADAAAASEAESAGVESVVARFAADGYTTVGLGSVALDVLV